MIAESAYRVEADYMGDVEDVVREVLEADQKSAAHTAQLAEHLEADTDKQTFRNIWKWVRKNIRYIPDRGTERVKSPAATYKDRFADCKSMAVMVGSILQNLGKDYYYRVTFYDRETPDYGHIYVIARTDRGEQISIDPVHDQFNREPSWWKKKDYMRAKTRIQRIQGLGQFPEFNPPAGGPVTAPPKTPGSPGPSAPQQPGVSNNNLIIIAAVIAAIFLIK